MTYRLAIATRNKSCDAIVDALDVGAGDGTIQIRSQVQAATPDSAAPGTLLGTLTFPPTAFGGAANGAAVAGTILNDNDADDTGTALSARLLDGGGAIHSDCSCGQGSGDISFDNSAIVIHGVIAINSMTITQPM